MTNTSPPPSPAPITTTTSSRYWALDSNRNELDPKLKAALGHAQKEFAANDNQEEYEEPIVLRNLLNEEQIAEILKEVSTKGVWPRGSGEYHKKKKATPTEEDGDHCHEIVVLSDELSALPHHYAWTDDHIVLYMHNNDHWFVRTLPDQWGIIRGGMEARPWMNSSFPVLDSDFVGVNTPSMMQVRTVELHHYSEGGGLVTPGHRDCGSELTISVLLSDTDDVDGGDFVTYCEGVPIAHKMSQGDAILFNSQKLHNVSTVTSGLRKSLVVELWPTKRY